METIAKSLEDLTAFHMVAKERSFTRAAEYLGSSKAMMSKQVRRLETSLGLQLFQRTTRSLSLTSEGVTLFHYSQKIFDLSDEAGKLLRENSLGHSGLIKISTPVSLGDAFFPSFLLQMKKVLPQMKFEADLSNERRDFKRDQIDFAIRTTEVDDPDLIARYLGQIKDVICISPSLNEKLKLGQDPAMPPTNIRPPNRFA